jgi:large subunit ribosomal protein L25
MQGSVLYKVLYTLYLILNTRAMELIAKIREKTGKKVKALRRQGIVPAVLYGKGKKAVSLEVGHREFRRILKEAGETTVVKLKIEGGAEKEKGKERNVLIYGVEKDPLTERFMHVDFYEVRMDEKMTAFVPLVFVGEAPAAKAGGTLVKSRQEIEVKALPKDLPREIEINISGLETFEDRIFAKDIKTIEGVEILAAPEEVITLVAPPRKEEEVAQAPAGEGEQPAGQIEEVGEKKEQVEEKQEKAGEKE